MEPLYKIVAMCSGQRQVSLTFDLPVLKQPTNDKMLTNKIFEAVRFKQLFKARCGQLVSEASVIDYRRSLSNKRRSAPVLIHHCHPGHPLFLTLFHSAPLLSHCLTCSCGVVQEEDTSMLSACNRWQLWGRPWLSEAGPAANYPQ